MGVEVRAIVRQGTSPPTSSAHRPHSGYPCNQMAILIAGRRFWLWRAIDDEGEVLDLLVQRRRDKTAAVNSMRKAAQKARLRARRVGARQAAFICRSEVRPGIDGGHEQGLRRNNRAENSAPAGSSPRAEDAAVQIARISPTVPVRSCRSPERVQRPTPSRFRNTLRALRGEALRNWRAATAA